MPANEKTHVFNELSPVSVDDLICCSYSKWYSKYKLHVLSEAEIVKPLPELFIKYLLSDGIKLPDDDSEFDEIANNSDFSDWEEGEEVQEEEQEKRQAAQSDSKVEADPTAGFDELHQTLKDKISKLGNNVTPKLNWSAPKDSTWILPNNIMLCRNVKDLYLALNASNYIMHDLTETFNDTTLVRPKDFEFELVLRKWHHDLNPALEFRCFVKNRTLIAISQRDLNYYTYLDDLYDEIFDALTLFFERHLQTSFDINNFIFDIYIPRPFNKTYLVDINPFSRVTDSLLFTWNELSLINEKEPDFIPELRLVDEVNTGRFASKEHSENQVPKDIVDATMDSNAMAELAREWKRMMDKEDTDDESSDDN